MAFKTVVAIPCYNCEKQIARVLSKLSGELLDRLDHVLVVDNRSTDKTVEVALSAAQSEPKIVVIRNEQNYGLGGSHKVAFSYAVEKGLDYLAIVHGDDQGDMNELNLLLDKAIENPKAAAVLGARFMPKSRLEGYSKTRILGNLGLNGLYSLLSGRRTYDMGSGINLFKVSELRMQSVLSFSDRFTFNMDLLLSYFRRKSELVFVPITWSETDQISNAKTFRVGWEALMTLLKWRVGLIEDQQGFNHYSYETLN